ncbi:acyl-CoA synthetase (NDP forming)/RimJ/RimL family protein N-acetyltransferase [Thermocatellispora tengchongensis]|uniref:Acyl-CoA synthetase (NDP forming)/RimJ/RimL family protein N-acetyltransferase n=1 Tax=Thermocatellispora tengchongensis TaxID=1073253 RepID=A0A840P7C4_9ACTN|nr:bifunctional GNAT family N-acetyltransferase/acetate--CoA ligase family protein [Thermocatellispora tengchongensis]MBB5135212.1 acyl-CoA synthetase (NDP forming)/RimJ/RimL family protein N-acetyltransferase [Thermocatellispora tengchongensis]
MNAHETTPAAGYPAHWEADVVLADGGTAHVRPIRPADADRLRAFYSRLSDESIYFRFFGPRPRLSDREVERFTNVDYHDRVALIATIGTEMVAVIRYDRIADGEAEVAFLVEDAHQGRGVASVLLEHLAATARENGIGRFVADVLPANQRMMGVLRQAGYTGQSTFEDGVVRMTLDLTPTETAHEVTVAREHRAEARSIERLLTPGSVAVIGASREPGGVGQMVLRNLLRADFTGPVYPVHREVRAVAGVRAYPSVTAIDGEVDLAVLAVPAQGVIDVVKECAEKGVRGLIVVSSGFGETGPEGRERQDELVRIARAYGLRVVGPNCLGIANTDPAVRLNATLAATVPARGRVGFFSQSGALGAALLQRVAQRGMGLSSFVSAGNRADVSGNDLLQYWEEDPATDVILLYLESFGNPRKFARLARRISRRKPIVAVKSGRTTQGVPVGHAAPVIALPDTALSSLFEQAGVIRVDDLMQQFDVAQLLAHQPLPAGPGVAVVSNSDALTLLAADACVSAGLTPTPPVNLGPAAGPAEYGAALADRLADDDVHAVVVIYTPPIPGQCDEVAAELLRVVQGAAKPVLATYQGRIGMLPELSVPGPPARSRNAPPPGPGFGSIPSYAAPEEAVRALAHVVRYAAWRARPAGPAPIAEPSPHAEAARALVRAALERAEPAETVRIDATELLGCYGVTVWPAQPAASAEEALAAAERLGWPVVVKAADPRAAERAGTVRLGLAGPETLRQAYADLSAQLGPDEPLAVQRMAPQPAVPVVISVVEDPAVGPVVSFGLGEVTARLLGDVAYRLAPLTDGDAAELVRAVRAAPLLLGGYGYPPVAVKALEDLLVVAGRVADELPEVERLDLDPVLVGQSGVTVLAARAVLRSPRGPRPDDGPRRLR